MSDPLEARFRSLDFAAMTACLQHGNMRLDVMPDLPSMNIPTFFYAGSEDEEPHRYAPLAAEMMPNAQFVTFPGYTHGTLPPEADLVLAHVLPFLAKNS